MKDQAEYPCGLCGKPLESHAHVSGLRVCLPLVLRAPSKVPAPCAWVTFKPTGPAEEALRAIRRWEERRARGECLEAERHQAVREALRAGLEEP